MKQHGFTLAELLISLGVVGTLSAFFVPQIINNMSQRNNDHVIRESILAANIMLEESFNLRENNLMRMSVERLSTVRNCGDNNRNGDDLSATADGCWNNAVQGNLPAGVENQGVLMKNGAAFIGLHNNFPATAETLNFIMDANGTAGPNAVGRDQLLLTTCTTNAFCDANANMQILATAGYKVIPGKLLPIMNNSGTPTASQAYYDALFTGE